MDNNNLFVCSVCHQSILPEYYFCPNCGNSLKEKPIPISIITQTGLYALSIFLPPFGLWPGIKYITKKSPQAKQVGTIILILTLISTVLTIWATFTIFQSYINQLNEVMNGL
jgi:hypothetical protein